MRFRQNFECETKIRCDCDHDYTEALGTIGLRSGSVLNCGREIISDTYFDTYTQLLLRHGHVFRKRHREGKSTKYAYKRPLETTNHICVTQEIVADTGRYLLDLGNPFHQKLPILAHLIAFFEHNNRHQDSDNKRFSHLLKSFSPQIQLRTQRTFYILKEEKWPMTLAILVDRVKCLRGRDRVPNTRQAFSELEMELWDGKVCPSSLDMLSERLQSLMALGYIPTHESKYSCAIRRLCLSRTPSDPTQTSQARS